MAVRQLSANDRQSYPATGKEPGHCPGGALAHALAAHHSTQLFVPKGTTTSSVTAPGSVVESRGKFVQISATHIPTADSMLATPVPQRTSLPMHWTSKVPTVSTSLDKKPRLQTFVRVPVEQLSDEPASSRVTALARLASSEERSCRVIHPSGGVSPQLSGRGISRSPDPKQIRDPQASPTTAGNCHLATPRRQSHDADSQLKLLLELSSRNHTQSENLKHFKSTMEGDVRACTQAVMEEVADRKQMEERLQVRWQTSFSEEVDARNAAVCRLDSEMTMLSANVHELREELQRLKDLMYGELHSLVQSMQGSADSAPLSGQGGQQRNILASVSNVQKAQQGQDQETSHQSAKALTACQERAGCLDRALIPQKDVNPSMEHRLQHAADILARAAESAAALHAGQLVEMHNECRFVLEKLLDESVQGCTKYSIVKEAIFQALDALGTKETEPLWRDTCWTLHKIEEWLTAKDQMVSGKDGLSAKKILDAAQANSAILLGSASTAHGSQDGSFPAGSTTASHGACSRG